MKNPPDGFSAAPVSLTRTQATTQAAITIKSDLVATKTPVHLTIEGRAKVGEQEIVHEVVPAEDRMQAFLWRHLVTAQDLSVLVFDPLYEPAPKRALPIRPPVVVPTNTIVAVVSTNATPSLKGKFTKQQVAGRLRELRILYQDGLLTDEFYNKKMDECEALQ